jgi:rare lipoprotein A
LRASGYVSLLILALLAGGCATGPATDAAAKRRVIDPDAVPDAVPQVEPRSKYGNPPSYEVFGKRYQTLSSSEGFVERGIASWYGEDFHGKRASSGEPYDMFAMTAAHKELPLPTYARVTNLENGRSIVVKINDRGPFHANRVIDLSWVAASKLRITAKGTGLVEVRAIDPANPEALPPPQLDSGTRYASATPAAPREPAEPKVAARPAPAKVAAQAAPPPPAPKTETAVAALGPQMFIQVGAFSSRENADKLKTKVAKDLRRTVRVDTDQVNGKAFHRVQVGPVKSVDEADLLVARLESLGVDQPRVVVD